MTVTSGLHIQKDKERQQRMESDIRWGLKDPESGEEAQTRGRPARDRGLHRLRLNRFPTRTARPLGASGASRSKSLRSYKLTRPDELKTAATRSTAPSRRRSWHESRVRVQKCCARRSCEPLRACDGRRGLCADMWPRPLRFSSLLHLLGPAAPPRRGARQPAPRCPPDRTARLKRRRG